MQFEELNIIRDKNGRYIIIQGKLFNRLVVLANVYASNWDNADFFNNLLLLLPDLELHDLILGYDLNCVLDPSLDSSSAPILLQN